MFDLKSYTDKKAKGLINKVQKTNTNSRETLTYAIYEKQYVPDLAQTPPVYVQTADQVTSVTEIELSQRKADLQAEIDSISAFEEDALDTSIPA